MEEQQEGEHSSVQYSESAQESAHVWKLHAKGEGGVLFSTSLSSNLLFRMNTQTGPQCNLTTDAKSGLLCICVCECKSWGWTV